jgi:hypothetical protein
VVVNASAPTSARRVPDLESMARVRPNPDIDPQSRHDRFGGRRRYSAARTVGKLWCICRVPPRR